MELSAWDYIFLLILRSLTRSLCLFSFLRWLPIFYFNFLCIMISALYTYYILYAYICISNEQSIIRLISIMCQNKNNSNAKKLCNWIKVMLFPGKWKETPDKIKNCKLKIIKTHIRLNFQVMMMGWDGRRVDFKLKDEWNFGLFVPKIDFQAIRNYQWNSN